MKNISKNEPPGNKQIYKNYKSLFESIKNKSKKHYYSEKLLKLQGNAKQTWKVMKEMIEKAKLLRTSHLPQKITVFSNHLFDKKKAAKNSIGLLETQEQNKPAKFLL